MTEYEYQRRITQTQVDYTIDRIAAFKPEELDQVEKAVAEDTKLVEQSAKDAALDNNRILAAVADRRLVLAAQHPQSNAQKLVVN